MRAFLVDLWSHRGFRYTFLTVAVIAAFWLLLHLVLNWSGEKRWQRIKTQLESEGETFDFYALYPPPIPDDQNFCAIEPLNGIRTPEGTSPEAVAAEAKRDAIKDAASILSPRLNAELKFDAFVNGDTADREDLLKIIQESNTPPLSTNASTWQDVRSTMEKHAPILIQARAAARQRMRADILPRPRREELPEMLVTLPVPHLNTLQDFSKLLRFHGLVCIHCGDAESAMNSALAILRLSEAADASRTLLGNLVGVTLRAHFQQLAWLLLQSRLSQDASLQVLQMQVVNHDSFAAHLACIRSEIALSVNTIDYLQHHPRQRWSAITTSGGLTPATAGPASVLSQLIPSGFISHSKSGLIEMQHDYVLKPLKTQDLKNVELENVRLKSFATTFSAWRNPDLLMARLSLPVFSSIRSMAAYGENQRLQAILACALERHFLRHGSYPATLEALDPEFRGKNDLLDVNSEKMHYALIPGGRFRLWSPGPDGRDDGGKFGVELGGSRQPSSPHYLGDWVWRYDPAVKAP
jgi:hypothetical protein